MPVFDPGESKVAKVAMSNPKAKAFDYEGVLCMGVNMAAVAEASFHLEPNESKDISFPVTMPTMEGVYPVYLNVSSSGVLLTHYQATENIEILPPFNFYCLHCGAGFQTWAELLEHVMSAHPGLPALLDVYAIQDIVASGEEFGITGRIFLPTKPEGVVAWRLRFWYWEEQARGTKDFGYLVPLPEGVYEFGIAMPTERHRRWIVPPGTYPIYASCYLWRRPDGDVLEPVWENVDTGLRITVI